MNSASINVSGNLDLDATLDINNNISCCYAFLIIISILLVMILIIHVVACICKCIKKCNENKCNRDKYRIDSEKAKFYKSIEHLEKEAMREQLRNFKVINGTYKTNISVKTNIRKK